MTKQVQIVSNAVLAKLIKPSIEVKQIVTEALSYYVDGYENTDSFKRGTWDGRSSMFDWKSDTFPVGFRSLVNAILDKNGYEVTNIGKALPEPLGTVPETLGGFSYTERYDYQWQGVEALEKRGIMVARLATGAGKTFHAALATARINRPTLILTKRQPLLYQFWERMKDFGFDPGIVGDNRFLLRDELTISMSQTLSKRLEQNDETSAAIKEYLKKVEFLIGEEVHEVSDSSYWNIIQHCPNAYYRLGLTATPFMRVKSESNMKLLGSFGPVGIEVSEKTLIDRGINARPIFKFATYPKSDKLKFGSNYHKAIFEGITHCQERNAVIIEHAKKAAEKKLSTLILVQRKEHGNILLNQLRAEGIKATYIFGDHKSDERRSALTRLANGKIDVLIGSTILDVGVDVPSIGLVIMAGGGKAEVSFRQRIGRGLREKKSGPNVCFVLDFADVHNHYLNEHYRERLKMIKYTEGFAENLLSDDEDFPWRMF